MNQELTECVATSLQAKRERPGWLAEASQARWREQKETRRAEFTAF
jgi:hypothetical protein